MHAKQKDNTFYSWNTNGHEIDLLGVHILYLWELSAHGNGLITNIMPQHFYRHLLIHISPSTVEIL